MAEMDIMELPNRETRYFCRVIRPWIAKEEWVNWDERKSQVTFKKGTPIDVINKFLICRPKLADNYIREYKIEK